MRHLSKDQLLQQRGNDLYDSHGDKVGKIVEIYLDSGSWALVNTGLFGAKSSFVPLREASDHGGTLSVPYEKGRIKDAPDMDADGQLSPDQERALWGHYEPGRRSDVATTRPAQELTGDVRLHRYIVEDEANETFPLRREEIRVEREPIDADQD